MKINELQKSEFEFRYFAIFSAKNEKSQHLRINFQFIS